MLQPSDHFLSRYRSLLDAEDVAFDELEHACEDGDRAQFDKDLVDWQCALQDKLVFLQNAGIELRFVENLWPTIDAILDSGLGFSIIRKANALPRALDGVN